GMGDVLGLIEKVEETVDREQAEAMANRLRRNELTLDDYRQQLAQVRKMGSLEQVLGMIPGLGQAARGVDTEAGEKEMKRAATLADSVPPRGGRGWWVITGSRRKRIARGSGTTVEDVNRLLRQFAQARKLMKQFGGGGKMMKKFASRMANFR